MTGGATFAHTLTTICDDHDDSQTLDRHINLTCGLFVSCGKTGAFLNPWKCPPYKVQDGSDLFATLHANAQCCHVSCEMVEEIVEVFYVSIFLFNPVPKISGKKK